MKKLVILVLAISFSEEVYANQCSPLHIFRGFDYWEYFGAAIDIGGDANGDGYDDIIVGAGFLDFEGQEDKGAAFVFSGLTGDTLFVFRGGIPMVYFGLALAWAGDVNNDGHDDIIVDSPGGSRTYVFSGLDGDTLYVFTIESENYGLGRSVASAGDVDNDGHDDMIVGVHGFDNSRGKVYVFSGSSGEALFVLSGNLQEDNFGIKVSSAGDVNGDGFDDFMISTDPAHEPFIEQVFVFSGLTGDTLHIFSGDKSGGTNFGGSTACAGDVNGDGYDDLIIGESGYSGTALFIGRIYVFSGVNGDTIEVLTGQQFNSVFGSSVSGAGDVDQDGYSDYMVAASGYSMGDLGPVGRVYVFSGQTGDTLQLLTGNGYYMRLGGVANSAGDVDADGYRDIAFHSLYLDSSGEYLTRVSVYPAISCRGNRGDINGDQFDADFMDLINLVDRIFRNGPNLSCFVESDVNSDGTHGNILDLAFLVNRIFRGGLAPGPC